MKGNERQRELRDAGKYMEEMKGKTLDMYKGADNKIARLHLYLADANAVLQQSVTYMMNYEWHNARNDGCALRV